MPHIAKRFKEAVKKTTKEIGSHADAATPCHLRNPELKNLRSWPVDGFEAIRLYFLVEDGAIRVIRILHGKRNVRGLLERDNLS